MRARFAIVLSALASTAIGCSIVADFDGLVGPNGDGSAPIEEAGAGSDGNFTTDTSTPADGTPSEQDDASNLDAPITDGGTTMPTNDGAPTQLQGSGGHYCTTDAAAIILCDDFNPSGSLNGFWDTDTQGSGSLGVQGRSFFSSPHAFLGYLQSQTSGDNYQAVSAEVPFGSGHYKVEFKFYLNVNPSSIGGNLGDNNASIMELAFDNSAGFMVLFVGHQAFQLEMDTYVDGGESDLNYTLSKTPPVGAWHAMVVDIAFSTATAGSLTVSMDGTQLFSQSGLTTLAPGGPSTNFNPGFGIENVGKVGETYLYVDDVRITQE